MVQYTCTKEVHKILQKGGLRHLILFHFAKGESRLQSHGGEYQRLRSSTERATKLKDYQQEMQSFATFLKEHM